MPRSSNASVVIALWLPHSAAVLVRPRDELTEIEATDDQERKRQVVERYVRKITVETHRIGPRRLEADVRVYLRLKLVGLSAISYQVSARESRGRGVAESRSNGTSAEL